MTTTQITQPAPSYLLPAARTACIRGAAGRKVDALVARLERPGSVGELVACANALVARGVTFCATVDYTGDASVAGVRGAWICSRPEVVQALEADELTGAFHPHGTAQDYGTREVYETRERLFAGDERTEHYVWTFERVGRAWVVIVEQND